MMNVAVYNPDRLFRLSSRQYKDQARDYHVDANYWSIRDGTTLSSAVWTLEHGDATIGADSEASNVSTALITTSSEVNSLIKVVLTLADGQIGVQYIEINVPDVTGNTKDYN
mgnify:CR=1 FL=1|tara:strand:+ start:58 stop:393 length:336 start_codon:yes stop_codon:yes gene_type:complete